MSLILALPLDVVREGLIPFISIKGLVRLDSAVCVAAKRCTFLSHLDSLVLRDSARCSTNALIWLRMRNVCISSFYLDKNREIGINDLRVLTKVSMLKIGDGTNKQYRYQALMDLLQSIKSLSSVSIRGNTFNSASDPFNDDLIEYIVNRHPHLTNIEIHVKDFVSDRSVNTITQNCKNLRSISLCWNDLITSGSVISLFETFSQTLRNVKLEGLGALDDSVLISLGQNCPHLESLWFNPSESEAGSDIAIFAVARGCPKLRAFCMYGKQLTDVGLLALTEHCPLLTDMTLDYCAVTTDALELFFNTHQQVTRFTYLRDGSVPGSLNNCIQHWTQMTYLKLAGRDQHNIDDVGVRLIATHCLLLQYCRLNGCELVTDESLTDLAVGCRPRIEYLKLHDCSQVTDAAIIAFAQSWSNLKELSCGGATAITDASLLALATHCQQLQRIWFFNCAVTDTGVQAVIENCPELVSLDARGCRPGTKYFSWIRSDLKKRKDWKTK